MLRDGPAKISGPFDALSMSGNPREEARVSARAVKSLSRHPYQKKKKFKPS